LHNGAHLAALIKLCLHLAKSMDHLHISLVCGAHHATNAPLLLIFMRNILLL
jgi:hypothetical protein